MKKPSKKQIFIFFDTRNEKQGFLMQSNEEFCGFRTGALHKVSKTKSAAQFLRLFFLDFLKFSTADFFILKIFVILGRILLFGLFSWK